MGLANGDTSPRDCRPNRRTARALVASVIPVASNFSWVPSFPEPLLQLDRLSLRKLAPFPWWLGRCDCDWNRC